MWWPWCGYPHFIIIIVIHCLNRWQSWWVWWPWFGYPQFVITVHHNHHDYQRFRQWKKVAYGVLFVICNLAVIFKIRIADFGAEGCCMKFCMTINIIDFIGESSGWPGIIFIPNLGSLRMPKKLLLRYLYNICTRVYIFRQYNFVLSSLSRSLYLYIHEDINIFIFWHDHCRYNYSGSNIQHILTEGG